MSELAPEFNPDETQEVMPQQEEASTRFATPEEIAESYMRKLDVDPSAPFMKEYFTRAVLFEKAGRNLDNLAHHISAKEKRPVLALNNPRTGALYQAGFKHWLESFSGEAQAEEFIAELEGNEEYRQAGERLDSSIRILKDGLEQLFEAISHDLKDKGREMLSEITNYPDPSIDIRLELISNTAQQNGDLLYTLLGDEYAYTPEKTKYIQETQQWLDTTLIAIQSIKDNMRAIIFSLASQWLKSDRIQTFIYPINHWKLSSSGPQELEIDKYGQAKLYRTISVPDTFVLFSDPKQYRMDSSEEDRMSIRSGITRSVQGGGVGYPPIGDSPFARMLRDTSMLKENLDYPLSPHAEGQSSSIQKRLIEEIHGKNLKVLDIQGLMPDQRLDLGYQQSSLALPSHRAGEQVISPDYIMTPGYDGENNKIKQMIEDMRQTAPWVDSLKSKIPLESNYGYGGPEEG